MTKINLFCFPYAGASAIVYNNWKAHVRDTPIEVHPVELAGRGTRFREPLYQHLDELLADVYASIKERLDEGPYALFGHSLGSWVAYELAYQISQHQHRAPEHIFFSGRRAPHVYKKEINYHELTDEQLKQGIIALGGTPEDMFAKEEFARLYLGIIRADFKLLYDYQHVPKAERLGCPITVLSGKHDHEITTADLLEWKKHTSVGCTINKMPGGHFFINEQMKDVIGLIHSTLVD